LLNIHKNGPIFHSYVELPAISPILGPDLGILGDPGTCRSPAKKNNGGPQYVKLPTWTVGIWFLWQKTFIYINLLLELGIHTLNIFKYLSVEVRQKCIHDIVSDFTEKSGQIRILTYTYQPGEWLFGIVTPTTHHFH
jgi:hypothetical protein